MKVRYNSTVDIAGSDVGLLLNINT